MENKFRLEILAPDKILYEGEAVSLVVPASGGYLGILASHAPILAALRPGKISGRDASGRAFSIPVPGHGYMHVRDNMATVLLDPEDHIG